MDKEQFLERFPEAEWLEDWGSFERWSDMQGEGSLTESLWFCKECGAEVDSPLDGCECGEGDSDEPRTFQGTL